MNTLNASQPFPSEAPVSRFESAKALAFSIAESANELLEPELIAWIDRSTANASSVLEGCSGPNGWHDYGVSHGGRIEVKVGEDASFIFAEASPFDSYEHFGPGSFVNLRDEQGNEVICRVGGIACVPLDEWTSKLT
jgi:hypothetical protein